MTSDAETRIKPYLDTVLEAVAKDRGCEVDDLSMRVVRSVTDALLWALYEGYDMAHDEPTVKTTLPDSAPRGVWVKDEDDG